MTRYVLDRSTRRIGRTVIGGSPLTLFRLSAGGGAEFDRLAAGTDTATTGLAERLLDAGAIHPRPVGSTIGPLDVTVVVPAHRTAAAALRSIADACADAARVLVIDDGSVPPIGVIPGADVLRLDENLGPAGARNHGLAATSTPFVAFVDDDVTVRAGWLDALLAHFSDDRVAVVAPRIASAVGSGRVARYERRHSPLDLGADRARIAPGTRVSYVPAAALVVRVEVLRSIGGFDATMRFGEDVDAVWRLVAGGWRARYEPDVVVEHLPRADWAAFVRQRIGYGSSAAPLARRHPRALAPVRLSGWTAGVWALAALGRWRSALALAIGTSLALLRKLPELPATVSLHLVGTGHLYAGRLLADAVRRVWWPLFVPAAVVSWRARRVALLAAVAGLVDGGPARLLDDASYGVGVWRGVVSERSARALVPTLTSWPGRARRSARTTDRYRRRV